VSSWAFRKDSLSHIRALRSYHESSVRAESDCRWPVEKKRSLDDTMRIDEDTLGTNVDAAGERFGQIPSFFLNWKGI